MGLRAGAAWLPRLNFIRIHYAWIIFCALLSLPVLMPQGNLAAIDAFFFGASGSTESGLNTIDVKDIPTYQQVYIYVIPIITNLLFINAMVVPVRLLWFRRRLREAAAARQRDAEFRAALTDDENAKSAVLEADPETEKLDQKQDRDTAPAATRLPAITWDDHETLPRPRGRLEDDDRIEPVQRGPVLQAARSIEKAVSSAFVLGDTQRRDRSRSMSRQRSLHAEMPRISRSATVGRNSSFHNLTEADRELLGGIEYRALKMLLYFVFGYLIALHLIGVICLLPWIHTAPSKYTDWLEECGIGKTWWAFYSSQTMVNNLGFTLTPDSMATFKDATWPMLVLTFLAFAGNTCYPVLLRLSIWTAYKLAPKTSQAKETLHFLLEHPRRCYTLLFPSRPTWILFGIVFVLNFVDVVLIVALDLDNPAVNDLPMGPRILSALFQAASSRHTGTSTLNLALVNPAVQFSLLTMMYIAIFPIAISIRASNTYQDRALGVWEHEENPNEQDGVSYVMTHVRNQLSFDLWYIFFGTFLVCIAESKRIMDPEIPSFAVFPVLFEVVSAYGNVGLSLGGPSGFVSMVGHYGIFAKLVICAMMIRGRHRGLPYALDRAINLPDILTDANADEENRSAEKGVDPTD